MDSPLSGESASLDGSIAGCDPTIMAGTRQADLKSANPVFKALLQPNDLPHRRHSIPIENEHQIVTRRREIRIPRRGDVYSARGPAEAQRVRPLAEVERVGNRADPD